MYHPAVHYDFLERAEEFYEAFCQLPPVGPRGESWPRYFLFCHAIELALKAFLARFGVSPPKLEKRPFGHDIDSLMTEALARGLNIGSLAVSEIRQLNEAHMKNWPRYPSKEVKPWFVIDQFEPYVVELLQAVSVALRGPWPCEPT